MNIEGVLTKLDLGPGVWVVRDDRGVEFTIDGNVPEGLDGKRVKVEGKAADVMGIGMVGVTISTTSIVRA
jgi:hypothetical protein